MLVLSRFQGVGQYGLELGQWSCVEERRVTAAETLSKDLRVLVICQLFHLALTQADRLPCSEANRKANERLEAYGLELTF